jgi:hypothetical protein
MTLKNGIPFTPPPFPNYDAGQYPQSGYAGQQAPAVWYDRNAGRPARQWQWSVGIQREIFPNLAVEAAYVGNRGVWWNSPGLVDINTNTPERLAAYGFDINNAADRTILTSQLGSAAAIARGVKVPYNGYPLTNTVAQSLRPFPQFTSISCLWCPLGKTWYDSLQVKATKRLSNGLSFSSNLTWSKNFAMGSPSNVVVPGTGGGATNDVFKRDTNKYLSNLDQPFIYNIALNYTIPALRGNKFLSYGLKDWTIGVFGTWASGLLIQAPFAQNNLNSILLRQTGTNLTPANRVAGQPLFLKDPNCHCFDPAKEFVLNPKAWSDPAAGTFGTGAAYYSDYRWQRQPQENFAFGRTFRLGESGRTFNIRAEFTNIFNRARMPTPTSTSALATQTPTPDATGHVETRTSAGFGFVNTASAPSTPASRQGTIVGRFTF